MNFFAEELFHHHDDTEAEHFQETGLETKDSNQSATESIDVHSEAEEEDAANCFELILSQLAPSRHLNDMFFDEEILVGTAILRYLGTLNSPAHDFGRRIDMNQHIFLFVETSRSHSQQSKCRFSWKACFHLSHTGFLVIMFQKHLNVLDGMEQKQNIYFGLISAKAFGNTKDSTAICRRKC
jgi:hypothetical protein